MAKQVDYQLSINLAGTAYSAQAFKRIRAAVNQAAEGLGDEAAGASVNGVLISITDTTPVRGPLFDQPEE